MVSLFILNVFYQYHNFNFTLKCIGSAIFATLGLINLLFALFRKEKNIVFSDDAKRELGVTIDALREIVDITVDSFVNDDFEMAAHVEPIEQVIDKLKDQLKARHIDRLQKGECTVQMGFVFSDLLTNIERVSDHCSNIAVYTIQQDSPKLDTHKYLRKVKTAAVGKFIDEYESYEKKYSLD